MRKSKSKAEIKRRGVESARLSSHEWVVISNNGQTWQEFKRKVEEITGWCGHYPARQRVEKRYIRTQNLPLSINIAD